MTAARFGATGSANRTRLIDDCDRARWETAGRAYVRLTTTVGPCRESGTGSLVGSRERVRSALRFWALPSVLLLSLGVLLPNAWVADDAYITLRTVDHFCDGRGLIYNPGERVQAYTHPLWMFALSAVYWVSGAHYWGTIALGLVCSLLAISGFVAWHGRHHGVAAALTLALLGSRAFVDFSTSGLENSLTHGLLVLFYAIFFREPQHERRRWLSSLTLTAAALLLCRMDAIWLVLPALFMAAFQSRTFLSRRALIGALALGMTPWLAWASFALVYYGSAVPNTALAKLHTGLPQSALIQQGVLYVLDVAGRDPWTLLILLSGLLAAALRPAAGTWTLAVGLLFHLAYVLFIGGDFMSGRFFSAPLVLACLIIARSVPQTATTARGLAIAAVLGGCLAVRPTWGLDFQPRDSRFGAEWDRASGVSDEQAYWYRSTGILSARQFGVDMPRSKGRNIAEQTPPGAVLAVGAAGMIGFFAHPTIYILDHFALVDGFLARLPSVPDFRPGHFRREIPAGYRETLASGDNTLQDARLRRIYDDVRQVTRGPLLSADRLKAIGRLHFSRY
jgi:arabinofuranosyltransferase